MIALLRALALAHALAHMAATGQVVTCKPVWTHDPRTEPQLPRGFTVEQWYAEPSVACGTEDTDDYSLGGFTCTPRGCWP